MIIPIFRATVKNAQLLLKHPANFRKYLLSFRNNTDVDITVKRHEETISDPLRKYYFKVVMGILSEDTGHSKEQCHEAMKIKFSSEEIDGMLIVHSVFSNESKMGITRKKEFIAEVKQWMWDFRELTVPDPGEAQAD